MNEQNHIIQKLSVEVNVPDLSMARRIHNNIGAFLQDTVLPAVEMQINELVKKAEYYRVGNLSVDLSFDNENDLENLLPAALISALIKQTGESAHKNVADKSKNISDPGLGKPGNETTVFEKKTKEEKTWELFIGFLQTGRLPWYASAHIRMNEKQLLKILQDNNNEKIGLKNILIGQPYATDRLIKQFSHDFVFKLAEKVFGVSIVDYWERIKQLIPAAEIQNRNLIDDRIITGLFAIITNNLQNISAEERLGSYIKEISTRSADTKSTNQLSDIKRIKPEKKKKQFPAEEESGIYIQNAGLVLLHPFLLYFFKEFDLLDDTESFKNDETRETAIHLLHYLATGEEQPFEYDLLMEKFLCGLDLDEPVERFVILTEKMKSECTHLLEAVIHHWKVLKSTSPGGLRQGFLQRNGKLSRTAYQHRLVVESGTIDILLNQLPWNYSIIQLPWMQQVFYVDWLIN